MSKQFFIFLSQKDGMRSGEIQHMTISSISDLSEILLQTSLCLSNLHSTETDVACLYNTRTKNKIVGINEIRDDDVIIATEVLLTKEVGLRLFAIRRRTHRTQQAAIQSDEHESHSQDRHPGTARHWQVCTRIALL